MPTKEILSKTICTRPGTPGFSNSEKHVKFRKLLGFTFVNNSIKIFHEGSPEHDF